MGARVAKLAHVLFLYCVLTLPATGACDVGSEQESEIPLADIELNADDTGGRVELHRGQTLAISLEADFSSGFNWEISQLDLNVLRGTGTQKSEHSLGLPGFRAVSGLEVLLFEAVDVGDTHLELVYDRLGEEDEEPQASFVVEVVVR